MLSIEDLSVFYGPIQAVAGLSLQVEAGEIVALLGANGAGKTTTLRAVSGLVPLKAGRIRLAGREITRLSSPARLKLGLAQVPEGRQVFPELTVQENLDLGAFIRRDPAGIRADLAKVFEYFPILAERRRQVAGTLSGGEQQMLAIARALMARPCVLLLDEPSLGIAPLLTQQIFAFIGSIAAAGTGVLLVEQNSTLALKLARRAYVLRSGRVVAAGPAAELAHADTLRRSYLGRPGA